jgi:ABC-type ATPase involved in cell division
LIETSHLSKLYKRGVYALRDLSITIDKGEFMFLTGPSGAGKSTFLRLLLREELPSEGDLKVLGRDLRALRPPQVQAFRRSVGFVFQDFRLIPRFSVFQNVAFVMRVLGLPLATQQRKTFQVLKWVGLQHRMNSYPEELSGGEQQRIAIAVATANAPQVIFADEPTGELDSATSEQVFAALRAANRELGVTVVVVTHDPLVSEQVDRTVAIRDGRTSSEVLRRTHIGEHGDELVIAEEYAVLDRAGRVQLPRDFVDALELSRRVRLELEPDHVGVWPDGTRAARATGATAVPEDPWVDPVPAPTAPAPTRSRTDWDAFRPPKPPEPPPERTGKDEVTW